ncbi:MAG: EamA family transporter [Candidatus Heimdallarchaeota archaeon]|nr:EamA family transporter [Candidatus Heimdallarchaeota archaeon]
MGYTKVAKKIEKERKTRLLADLALIIVTAIWGSTFVMVDQAVEQVSSFIFISLRFSIGFCALLIIFGYQLLQMKISWRELLRGMIIGSFLFAGYAFQTFGLQLGTSSSKAGFITGLSVVLVPFFATVLLKKAPHILSWLGIAIAVAGLALLSLETDLSFKYSDLLVLCCAFAFAFHIIAIDRFVKTIPYQKLAVIQVGTTTVLGWIFSLIFWTSSFPIKMNQQVIFAMIFTGVIATAGVFAVQTKAQEKTSPTHVAVIFTLEPVFAALFSFLLAGETLHWRQWVGCVLILVSMLWQQFVDLKLKPETKDEKVAKKLKAKFDKRAMPNSHPENNTISQKDSNNVSEPATEQKIKEKNADE